jgi:hypothetical protein
MKHRLAPTRIAGLISALFIIAMAAPPQASSVRPAYFSIATGAAGSSYFPVGSMIATILSHPAGSVRCDVAAACGPAGLIAVAVASQGALSNVRDVARGHVDSAFTQSDISSWAYRGTELFKAEAPLTGLRAIARLYPEPIQLVVTRDSGIKSVKDLKRRRVAAGSSVSATYIEAMRILGAENVGKRSFTLIDADAERAAALMRDKKLDAFFFVGAAPSDVVAGLVNDGVADLAPLDSPRIAALARASPYLVPVTIPAGAYQNVASTVTLAVGALWVVRASAKDDLIYQLTSALWDSSNRSFLLRGNAQAQNMTLEHALDGIGIPLHPGAARFYSEKGMVVPAKAAAKEADAHNAPSPKTR